MFCKNCGKENVSGGDACEFCGFDFSKSVLVENTSTNSAAHKIKSNKKLKVSLISIVLVLVALFAFYKIGTELTKPERVIKNYINAFVNADYETIYDILDIDGDELLSKENFISSRYEAEAFDNIEVTSISIKTATDDDLYGEDEPLPNSKTDLVYKVVYTTQIAHNSQTEIIYMTKTGKSFLFFDKYKIHPNAYITTEFSIDAPTNAEITVDGTVIDQSLFLEDAKCYLIPKIFYGMHTISIKSNITEDYQEKIEINDYTTSYKPELTIKSHFCEQITETTENILNTLFNGMVSNKSFEEIENELDFIKSQRDEIKENYISFCGTQWSDYANENIAYIKREIKNIIEDDKECSILRANNYDTANIDWKPFECSIYYNVGYEVEKAEGKLVWLLHDTIGEKSFNIKVIYCLENGNLKIYSIKNQRSS